MNSVNELAISALYSCKHRYEINFDKSIHIRKRNLLFISILSFASLIVSPNNDEYPVNFGVISGTIDKPYYIFGGLFLICLYHLYNYWINCRQTIFNSVNFGYVVDVYMFELASLHASKEWYNIINMHADNLSGFVPTFTASPNKPKENGCWKVRHEIQSKLLDAQETILTALQKNQSFRINCHKSSGFYEIDYIYEPVESDYTFLSIHKDQFWLTMKKNFVEYVLPVITGFLALIFLTTKTYYAFCGDT